MIIQKNTPKKNLLALSSCRKCGKCCTFDSGYLVEDDAKSIARHLRITTQQLEKDYLTESEKFNTKSFKPKLIKEGKPYGKCIFLKDNECSIHSVKPIHCRIGSPCSEHGEAASVWFTLNYFVNSKDPESIRQWSVYLRSHPTIPGGTLEELVPDKDKLNKMLKFEILNEKELENFESKIEIKNHTHKKG